MNCSKTAASDGASSVHNLFIPGPTWVDGDARAAMSGDMMGHRSPEFVELYESSQSVLQQMAGTRRPVYLAGCSSWGMMEASLRNLVRPEGKVLSCCCGAFSDRWYHVAQSCGFEADALKVAWGESIEPGMLRQALAKGRYDVVTLVHAETSTGVLNPLAKLAAVVREFDDTLLVVDTVSSYSAVDLDMDGWGLDVVLAGTQKALALPPGMCICVVSQRALDRASGIQGRGFYFDFLEYERNAVKGMTVSTPCIPIVMGLCHRASEIREEGLPARYARHEACMLYVEQWAVANGWEPLPAPGRRATTLNCLLPPAGVDVLSFVKRLKNEEGFIIDPGYGELKGKCIRISNMGVISMDELDHLFRAMGRYLL